MPEPTEDPIIVYNLRVIFFNWLPALGCLAAGVAGLIAGIGDVPKTSVGGGVYLLAGVVGFATFGWVWRR